MAKTVVLPKKSSISAYWYYLPGFTHAMFFTRIVASTGAILYSLGKDADECISEYECADDILQNCGISNGQLILYSEKT